MSKLEVVLGTITISIVATYFFASDSSFAKDCKNEGGIPIELEYNYCSFTTQQECKEHNGRWLESGLCMNSDGTYLFQVSKLSIEEVLNTNQ